MADMLRIANRGQSAAADLLAGTLRLVHGSWSTRGARPAGGGRYGAYGARATCLGYPPVVEQFRLFGQGTAAALRGAIDDLNDLLAEARRWHATSLESQSIWLEWSADGETARRALLYEGEVQVLAHDGLSPLLGGADAGVLLRVTLLRGPLWEAVGSTSQTAAGHGWGDAWQPATAVPGNEPARISALTAAGRSGGGGPLCRLWAGIRDAHQGAAEFRPLWECEIGTNGTDAADAADATASGGSLVAVDFATTAGPANRLGISVAQALAAGGLTQAHHYLGRYLVLCRCRVSAGATAGLQLRAGYANDTALAPCEEVYVDHSAWRLIPLGIVTIPPLGYRSAVAVSTYPANTQLQVWAELVDGTPGVDTLHLDALYLVPAEHLAMCEGAEVQLVGADPRPAAWCVLEDGSELAIAHRAGLPALNVSYGLADFCLPCGGRPLVVVAGERQAEHVLADALDVTLTYYPRWLAYSG